MKVRSGWGNNFMAKFNTGGAAKGSEPDAKLTPPTKISSRPVESARKLVKTAPRCSSQHARQESVDSILSDKSDKEKQQEWDMEITDVNSLGAEIDITKIMHSMKRGKRSARQMVKSSGPWVQQLKVLNSRKNVARVHRNGQGVRSKKMKRTHGGTKSRRVNNNRVAKGKKCAGGGGGASNKSIPASSLDEAKGRATDTNATEHLRVPKSDTSSMSKEQCGIYANEYVFKPSSSAPTAYMSSEVKYSSGPSEISLEQAAILMNNTFLGFTKSKGAVADDLMATTDVISLYQDRENCTEFDPAIIPGLDLNDGADKFDTSTAESALASLCSLCGVSVPDSCVEFAVKVLKDETPLPAEVSEVDGLFRQMTYRQKSTCALLRAGGAERAGNMSREPDKRWQLVSTYHQ